MGLLAPSILWCCSAVTIAMNGEVLLGHNNDNSFSRNMLLHITPNRDGFFGPVCVSMETVPGWVPTGMKCMNDQGLAITHANVPVSGTPYDADKPQFRRNFMEKIVAECATVKQAIALVRAYSLPPGPHGAHVHLMLADPSGDSAILEWADGEVKVIPRSGATQIMTNTLLSKPTDKEGPDSRLNRGRRMLAETKEASVSATVAVLKEISIHGRYKGDEVGSVESAVFNLTHRKVHLYYKRDFGHPLTLDLDQELAKGPHTAEFKTLFPNPVPFETGERYENGPAAAPNSSK